jgi:hypothetical protein
MQLSTKNLILGRVQYNATLNKKEYQTKVKVSDKEMQLLQLERHKVCPAWNYTIKPRRDSQNSGKG